MTKLSCCLRKMSPFLVQQLNSLSQCNRSLFILKFFQTFFLVPIISGFTMIVNPTMYVTVSRGKNPCQLHLLQSYYKASCSFITRQRVKKNSLSCNIPFLGTEMLSQPVFEPQSEMQSASISEEGNTGIETEREESLADNTEDLSVLSFCSQSVV